MVFVILVCDVAFLKLTSHLTIQERANIAARFAVCNSIVEVQRWRRKLKDRHATLRPETGRNCRAKLMTTGPVMTKEKTSVHSLLERLIRWRKYRKYQFVK